jgi:hypothetical protein
LSEYVDVPHSQVHSCYSDLFANQHDSKYSIKVIKQHPFVIGLAPSQIWPRKKQFQCDYWWPLDFTGVPKNDPAKYLRPMSAVWGIGGEKYSKVQDVSSIFYGFTASDDEVRNNHVVIPHEARAHFVAQGAIDAWNFALDLGPEVEGSTSVGAPEVDDNESEESGDDEEAHRLQRRGRKA